MRCDEVRDAFSDLYDERLLGPELVEVTQHLDGCPTCRTEWAAFSTTLQAVRRLGAASPSPGFAARVRQEIEAPSWWKRLGHSLFLPLHVKVPIHAVALAVLAFAGLMLVQRSPELRREVEVKEVPPTAATRQAPPAGSLDQAPPIPEKPAPAEKNAKAPQVYSKTEQAGSGVSPLVAASPPPPLAPPAKGAGTPSPQAEESAEAKPAPSRPTSEPGAGSLAEPPPPPALRLQRSAPTPAPSEEATRGPARAKALAPSVADQPSSLPFGSADELFSAAETEYARQEYEKAIERLQAFVATYPRDARMPDARFLLGEAYAIRRRYAEAIGEYETLIREYPDSPRVPAALYRQGQTRLALGDRSGCQLFRDVIGRYPQTPEASPAREALSAGCP